MFGNGHNNATSAQQSLDLGYLAIIKLTISQHVISKRPQILKMLYTSYDYLIPVARVADWSSAFLPTGKHSGAVRDDISLYSPE